MNGLSLLISEKKFNIDDQTHHHRRSINIQYLIMNLYC